MTVMKSNCSLIVALSAVACLAFAPIATAAWPDDGHYGDDYGIGAINDGAGPLEDPPAYPGSHAFWAGACDRTTAPAPGAPIPGGVGPRPVTQRVPGGEGAPPADIPEPQFPDHCIDFGMPVGYASFSEPAPVGMWDDARLPAWRLADETKAGAHPDGTAAFSWHRIGGGGILPEGAVDNIVVELPPGFVADPSAIPTCTSAQIGEVPITCPPESQVGLLDLGLFGVPFGGANNGLEYVTSYPVFNMEPRPGRLAEFAFAYASGEKAVVVNLEAKARTNGDNGVRVFTGQVPAALPPTQQNFTFWGIPWAAENDIWRGKVNQPHNFACQQQAGTIAAHYIPPGGLIPSCQAKYQPSWGPIKPFISNPTSCTGKELDTTLLTDSFQNPGGFVSSGDVVTGKRNAINSDPDRSDPDWKTYVTVAQPVTDCDKVDFGASITLEPEGPGGAANQTADSPTGLDVELTIPQNTTLPFNPPPEGASEEEINQYVSDATGYWRSDQGRATSHLRDTVVKLPLGMSLNPSAADGQTACTMEQMGVTDTDSPVPPRIRFDNSPVACPDSSKVGEVVVETPVLDEEDWPEGHVYLATQKDNPFGSDFAIYIAIRSPERGLIAKLAGEVEADPATGQLTTTFRENPELPFERFRLRFKAGPRAPLATPPTCGTHTSENALVPYSAPDDPVDWPDPFVLDSSPAGGCPTDAAQRPLNVGFTAGSTELVAGGDTDFSVRLTRPDGNQELDRLEVTVPEGLVAKLAGVPYCPEAAIAQAASRTSSGQGKVELENPSCPAASQVGTTVVGAGAGFSPIFVKGNVYLAGPYKGAPISLAVVVPAVAGPFDLGVQVVRTALRVNPVNAQVTAVSDTLPKIVGGVPLRIRDVRVDLTRDGFTINPTDCSEQLVTGKVFGASGAVTEISNRFQIAECSRLGFKPRMSLRLIGGTKRGAHPKLRAVVRPRPGDANIARAQVKLPRSAFLDQSHIGTVCTRVQFAASACPARSVYGKALAVSPLLDQPLTGAVYLRSSSNRLPDLVADLRGPEHQPIRIELSGRTDSVKGALRNTFDLVPDAPVSYFRLELFGGKRGLVQNSQDLCHRKQRANVKLTGQNGRKLTLHPVVQRKCKRKGRRGASRRHSRR